MKKLVKDIEQRIASERKLIANMRSAIDLATRDIENSHKRISRSEGQIEMYERVLAKMRELEE